MAWKEIPTIKIMEMSEFVAEANGERVDIFLKSKLPEKTRSFIKKMIDSDNVLINEKIAKPSSAVLKGDIIKVTFPDAIEYTIKPENIPLNIVYQDGDIAIINKPQGMTVHLGNGNIDGTLVNALLYNLDNLSGINGVIRPGIVHRIDKDTSGLLVVAKNDKAHLSLSEQIANKTCKREYIALLEGVLKNEEGQITTYIGRSPSDRVKMAVVSPDKGKLAITDYKVIELFENYTLCRFSLHTGRTHQIRVHAKHIGHPIVGDEVYGIKKQKFNLNGQLLHAFRLTLVHPTTKKEMTFEVPLPNYFTEILHKIACKK